MPSPPADWRYELHNRDQNTGTLYTTPADSVNGSFIFPRTWPMSFRETSTINISWSTKYEGINLYYYQRGKVATSIQLATNLGTNFFQWEVHADETNLTEPYVFRIVNSRGSSDEQLAGGFWSTSFYITRDGSTTTTTTSTASASSDTASAKASSVSSTITQSSASLLLSSTETAILSTNSVSATASIPVQTEQTIVQSNTGLGTGTVVGIAIGSALAVLALVLISWCFKKRVRAQSSQNFEPMTKPPPPACWIQQSQPQELYTIPPELKASTVIYELPNDSNPCHTTAQERFDASYGPTVQPK